MSGAGELQLMEGEVYVEEGEPTASKDCCCDESPYLGVTLYRCGCECCHWGYIDEEEIGHSCCVSRNAHVTGTITFPTFDAAAFMANYYDWQDPTQRYIHGIEGTAFDGGTFTIDMDRCPGPYCVWWQYLGSYNFPHSGWWDEFDDSGTGYVYLRMAMSDTYGMVIAVVISPEPITCEYAWDHWDASFGYALDRTCCAAEEDALWWVWGGGRLDDATPVLGSYSIELENNHCCTAAGGGCRYDFAQREMCVDGVYQACPGDIATAIQADNPELEAYLNRVIRMTDGNGVTICFHVGGPSGLTPVTLSAAMIASIVEYEIGEGEDWQDACQECCDDVY
jgi:hypothetical protein